MSQLNHKIETEVVVKLKKALENASVSKFVILHLNVAFDFCSKICPTFQFSAANFYVSLTSILHFFNSNQHLSYFLR